MNKFLLITLLLIIPLVSAEIDTLGTYKQDECVLVRQTCVSCSYVNVNIFYPNSTIAISNQEMDFEGGGVWTYEFCSTSALGRYDVTGDGDLSGTPTGFDVLYFEITFSGEQKDYLIIISDVVLMLVVLFLAFLIYQKHQKTDFGSWNDKIISEHKNMGQTMVSEIIYSLFKNTFVWFYFIGWIFIMILKDIIYRFNTSEIYYYFTLFANIYSIGLLLVVVYMIGYTITYMRNSIAVISDNNWGVGNEK